MPFMCYSYPRIYVRVGAALFFFFFLRIRPPPNSTLFPYPTLFRSRIQPFLENPPEMWDRLIAINLLGAVRLTRAVLPPMVAAQAGKIVNISSDAGRVGSMGETVYAAAKGGLIAFTKSLAREVARYRINVNCVCPGPTDTPLFQGQPERMREALTRVIPFRRIARPEEIAEAVMFFLSRRSDYITGQVLSVTGGFTKGG